MDAALFEEACGGFGRRLGAVGAEQWNAPTPCSNWDVRTLVNHVAAELLWVPPLLAGKTIAEVGDQYDGDILGDDPAATWDSAVAGALAAATRPGAQEGTVHLSFGDFPGGEYLGQVTSDLAIHSWDLATAVGGDERLPEPLVDFVATFLAPQIDAWRGAGAFGPAVDAGADADAQDRLLANTGRNPAR